MGNFSQKFDRLIARCESVSASDLHLVAHEPPYLRVQGVLEPMEGEDALQPTELEAFVEPLLEGLPQAHLEETGAIDGAFPAATGTRFRFNVFRRQGALAIALRRLEDRIRTLPELGLPDSLYSLSALSDGLVLVAGPTGSGKSTTLASLLDRINETRKCHIITIEDPIEYLHQTRQSLVSQRQIGSDASDFNSALVAALRQDPDVILVGEIRDLETIRTAITAAETGHLVFATVHASDCVSSLERLVSVFPVEEQVGIRRQLSTVLRAVIAQHLVTSDISHGRSLGANRTDSLSSEGSGTASKKPRLVLCSEVLQVNTAIANLIAQTKDAQIASMMETGASDGMYTLEENLARHLKKGVLSQQKAMSLAKHPHLISQWTSKLSGMVPSRVAR